MDSVSASFVKHQIKYIKNYIDTVYVISLTAFIPKFLAKCSFMHPLWRMDAYAENYNYDNVYVYYAKHFNLPLSFCMKHKAEITLNVVKNIINRKKLDFDLIHAHFIDPAGYVAVKLKYLYRKPVILTVHENREWYLKLISSPSKKTSYTLQNADKIIRVNKNDIENLKRLVKNDSKLIYMPNGYNSELFKPLNMLNCRLTLGLRHDKKIILNIASLETKKGHVFLIDAMENVFKIRKDVLLYIIGQGSLEKELKQLVAEKCLQDCVIFAGGNKPQEELPIWINACDIFIVSSLSESFGIVQIEALACGKPVVATYNGGSEEVIINEKLGVLVASKDSQGLACAILQALDAKWDEEFIIDYANNYALNHTTKNLIQVYESTLA